MTNKRGQITIFIIAGLLILIGASLTFYLIDKGEEKAEIEEAAEIPALMQPIQQHVDSCIKQISEEALIVTGYQGGYNILPELSTAELEFNTAYYFHEGNNIMPSIETVQQQISDYVDEKLNLCLKDFEVFQGKGYDITAGTINTNTVIAANNVVVNVDLPLSIKKGDVVQELSKFIYRTPHLNLKAAYDISANLTQEQVLDPDSLCLRCISELADSNNVLIDIVDVEENSILFTITDENSVIKDRPYLFRFVFKYKT